jgi:hypothetical protein
MSVKKRYYKLDDVGFVGVQENRTDAQVRKDASETARSIKALKARKSGTTGRRKSSTAKAPSK